MFNWIGLSQRAYLCFSDFAEGAYKKQLAGDSVLKLHLILKTGWYLPNLQLSLTDFTMKPSIQTHT